MYNSLPVLCTEVHYVIKAVVQFKRLTTNFSTKDRSFLCKEKQTVYEEAENPQQHKRESEALTKLDCHTAESNNPKLSFNDTFLKNVVKKYQGKYKPKTENMNCA